LAAATDCEGKGEEEVERGRKHSKGSWSRTVGGSVKLLRRTTENVQTLERSQKRMETRAGGEPAMILV